MSEQKKDGELGGDSARDTHREGLGDDYARDGGWSGGGGHEDFTREPEKVEDDPDATQKTAAAHPARVR